MKTVIYTLTFALLASIANAGPVTGTGPGQSEAYTFSDGFENRATESTPRQVILMGADENEVVYGETRDGINTRSVRMQIREVQTPVQNALEESAQSGTWVKVKERTQLRDLNRSEIMREITRPSAY